MSFHPQPKPRVRALLKQDRLRKKRSVEDVQNALVRVRSKGQCEVREQFTSRGFAEPEIVSARRCHRRASEVHHLLGGTGRRGIGESAKAENKQHLCGICHDLITRHILIGQWTHVEDRAGTVTYVRVK